MTKDDSKKNRACTGKTRHNTYGDAQKQLRRSPRNQKNGIEKALKVSIYLCSFCLGYHIGHSIKKK